MMRQASVHAGGDKSTFGVFVDPSTPLTRPELKPVNVLVRQPLQPGRTRNTASVGCSVLQEVNSVNKKFSLSPNSLIGAEKENFDPVRKELAVYRRSKSMAQPLEDRLVAKGSKGALPLSSSGDIQPGGKHTDDGVSSSSGRSVLSTPTTRILANRRPHLATGNATAGIDPASKVQMRCVTGSEVHMQAKGRPGRRVSMAVMPDRQPQRALPSRKPSSGAAGRAGVNDLVQLLDSMGMASASSLATARLAQLQGVRRLQQYTEVTGRLSQVAKAPELRLGVPPPVVRKPSNSSATPVHPPQDSKKKPNRALLPPPSLPNKPGNKQSKIMSSALLTPPELRKGIR
ncbi:hypothetical protein GGI10_003856 [Coemansia sp. RSA 2530]|nr:hypothetical protein GGI10_003856 [Coemansia sp. RSA 2530]